MNDLVIAVLLLLLGLLWSKNSRLQIRLRSLEAAETHFCQGQFPIDKKMLEQLQSKVGELYARENYDSENCQAAHDLFIDVSKLINYWFALHPAESRSVIDAAQQAGARQTVSNSAKRATAAALVSIEAESKPFVFTIDADVASIINQYRLANSSVSDDNKNE